MFRITIATESRDVRNAIIRLLSDAEKADELPSFEITSEELGRWKDIHVWVPSEDEV